MILYYEAFPEKLGGDYLRLVESFEEIGEKPLSGLDKKIEQAISIPLTATNQITDAQWKALRQAMQELEAERKRYNSLKEQQRQASVAQELSDLEKSLLADVPEKDREEISLYFRLKREQRDSYRDNKFIAAVSNVEKAYLLPLLKTTQAHLTGKRAPRGSNWDDEYQLLETLPGFFGALPPKYKDRVIDVLVTSAERGNTAGCIYTLAEQMRKQLGLVDYDDSQFNEPKKVPNKHKDFYLKTARSLAEANSPFGTEILESFPHLVARYGVKETRRIIEVTLRIKDEDFPGQNNVALFYIHTKAGIGNWNDQQKFEALARQVEAKYQRPNPS